MLKVQRKMYTSVSSSGLSTIPLLKSLCGEDELEFLITETTTMQLYKYHFIRIITSRKMKRAGSVAYMRYTG
jgi:hypothetical protein